MTDPTSLILAAWLALATADRSKPSRDRGFGAIFHMD